MTKIKVPTEILDKIVAHLQGSCEELAQQFEDEGYEFDKVHLESLQYIDDQIFNCAHCGWWFEAGEMEESNGGEWICGHCKADDEDDA